MYSMLEKEINELTYAQKMWILGGFWNHHESKGLDFISVLTQQLLDTHLVTSRFRTRVHRKSQLLNEFQHQSFWCPDDSDMRVEDPQVLEYLDGMTVTITADVVGTDDLTEDESEGSIPNKVLPTSVVHQALLQEDFDGGGDSTPSGSVAGILSVIMDGPVPYGE
jgi:hypothetical protein